MRMEESCGDGTLPSCTGIINEEQIKENTTSLLATDSSISCDTSNTAVQGPTQEKLDEDYCVEATRLILDLSK